MKNCTEWLLLTIFSLMISISYSASIPLSDSRTDLARISKIYHTFKMLQQKRNSYKAPPVINFDRSKSDNNKKYSDDIGFFLALGEPIRVATGNENEGQNLQKRQGVWDFDYGLGGGRFGKRGFGDYSLGGGRFGRDVDHVDPDFEEE